jgi:hypothetical protein
MTWGQEILRAVLLTFGFMEVFTNASYLLKKQGMQLARKQHGELPSGIADNGIRIKVICMLAFGSIFFAAALSSYIIHRYIQLPILVIAILFSVYGVIEAFCYKYWKTWGFAFVTILLTACVVFI